MLKLWQRYDSKMTLEWAEKVGKAAKEPATDSNVQQVRKHMARVALDWA